MTVMMALVELLILGGLVSLVDVDENVPGSIRRFVAFVILGIF